VLKLIPVSRLLYGSDAPFGSTACDRRSSRPSSSCRPADITAIRNENALRLFPRFAGVSMRVPDAVQARAHEDKLMESVYESALVLHR